MILKTEMQRREMETEGKVIVIKIGGSTLGSHDTTIEDLVALQKKKMSMVVVHGGAQLVTDWLSRLGISTSFIGGLRVTDAQSLEVVTAVLGGLVNKELVAAVEALGGKAVGICGVDGGLIEAEIKRPELGLAGDVTKVNVNLLMTLLKAGYIPIIAPISLGAANEVEKGIKAVNVNGDNVACEIAVALKAQKLIFLTDVNGVHDSSGKVISHLTTKTIKQLNSSGATSGGMIVKVEACLRALTAVPVVRIIDGRVPHILLREMEGKGMGTTITRG